MNGMPAWRIRSQMSPPVSLHPRESTSVPEETCRVARAAVVHESLKQRALLPSEHLVDKGYTDSHVLVDSQQQHGVTIVGPVADDPSWQARSNDGLSKSQFQVYWDRQIAACPAGNQSISWLPNTWPQNGMEFEVRFARKDCTPCALRPRCTRARTEPRIIGLQAREHHEALRAARQRQTTERSGVLPAKTWCSRFSALQMAA
jgi:transposase